MQQGEEPPVHQSREIEAPAPQPVAVTAPVAEKERIISIDVLRGIALLGILILNIQSFSMPSAAYMNPTAYGDLTGANFHVWLWTHVFCDMKFMTIFSLLFGAGILIFTERAEQRHGRSARLHYRRMGWLLLIGVLHAHLLWYGDILYAYAICGMIAYLLRKLPSRLLIILGVVAMLIPSIFFVSNGLLVQLAEARGWLDDELREMILVGWAPPADVMQQEIDAYRGGWLDQATMRSPMALMFETIFFIFFAGRPGGLMLIGMALYRAGVFSAKRSSGFYATLIVVGLTVGLSGEFLEVWLNLRDDFEVITGLYLYSQIHYWASPFVAMAWIGAVMLACKSIRGGVLLAPFAAVGQMALTNYLLQTIICTTIFYGHGFGLYGELSRIEQMLIVLGVTLFQLVFSPLWLRWFRFGPVEWAWRSLTYRRPQRLLRR